MKKNVLRKIALLLAIVMVLGSVAGCKSSEGEDAALDQLVDTNGLAGNEIEIEIPDASADDEPTTDEPATDEPSTDEPATDEPATDEPATDEPSTDEPATDEPATDEPSTDAPATDEEPDNEDLFEDPEANKPAYDPAKKLTVVSYNIKCAMYNKTIDQVAAQLKEVNADIVGLQECDFNTSRSGPSNQVQVLAEKAGYEYWYFAPVIELGTGGTIQADPNLDKNAYGHGILSKHPIKKSEIIWSQYQSETGECRNFERHEIDFNGKTIAFYNTHADFSLGRRQYFEVQEEYMSKDKYAICTGDFNETMDEMAGYFDYENFYSVTFGIDNETPILRESSDGKKSQMIDHIIVTRANFVWKDDEVQNGCYIMEHNGASDHNMVYAHFNLID